MCGCCNKKNVKVKSTDPCCPPDVCGSKAGSGDDGGKCPLSHFGRMIENCYEYATAAKKAGRPIVGIMCEYTPREIIMAVGAVPVCLCGGAAETIPAAEEYLPANLCPLIKSTFGYNVQRSNPFLEMADLIVAETTCDGKKKMYELLAESRDVYILELPQKQNDPDALSHWKAEVGKLKEYLEKKFGAAINDEKLRESIAAMNRERSLRRKLAGLMAADSPPLTGRQLLDLKSSISCMPADMEQYAAIVEKLSAAATAKDAASKVRVLLTGVPIVHGAERVVEIIEDHGGLIVCMENCTGIKPILDDVDCSAASPLDAIAEKYYHLPCSVMTLNDDRLDSLRRLAGQYRPDCVIELIWQACLTYDVESARVRKFAENELKLPYLRLETDYSTSDSARIAVRVEALYETVRTARSCT